MIFHKPQKKVGLLQLNIENTSIDRVGDFNFLGQTINEHLNWKSHIDKLANKISKTMGVLNKLKLIDEPKSGFLAKTTHYRSYHT